MDAFENVRRLRPDPGGDGRNVEIARTRLMHEIAAGSETAAARTKRRRWVLAAGVLGAGAAVTAGALVVSSIVTPSSKVHAVPSSVTREASPSPSASPAPTPQTAPEVLLGAAAAAADFRPPVLAEGQYVKREWTKEHLDFYQPGPDGMEMPPGTWGWRKDATSAWLVSQSGVDYVPADLRGQWYGESGRPEVREVFGDEAEAAIRMEPYLEGYGEGQPLGPIETPWIPESTVDDILWYFDALPRDPQAMVEWIRESLGSDREGWVEGKIGWLLIELLSYNVGDPEMRSSMYRALSLLPGSSVADEGDDALRAVVFEAHVASEPGGSLTLIRETVTIDMATGAVMEITSTSDVGLGIVPGDVPSLRITSRMSVVDGLP